MLRFLFYNPLYFVDIILHLFSSLSLIFINILPKLLILSKLIISVIIGLRLAGFSLINDKIYHISIPETEVVRIEIHGIYNSKVENRMGKRFICTFR